MLLNEFMYKAIISDLDGTLSLNLPNSYPSNKVIAAVKKIKQKYIFSIATGRTFYYAKKSLKILEIDTPCIVSGGAQIVNPETGEILWERPLDINIANEILKLCEKYSNYIFINNEKIDNNKYKFSKKVEYIFIGDLNIKQLNLFLKELTSKFLVSAHIIPAWKKGTYGFFITHLEGTKKYALAELSKLIDIPFNHMIGIGDGNNDLPLFESVGFKVAMGNAMTELKAAADLIIQPVEEDGAAFFLDGLTNSKNQNEKLS